MNHLEPSELKWIQPDGAPFMIVEEPALKFWHGCFGPTSSDSPMTDYDRACAVDDYIGVITVGAYQGLVLGDESMSTAWLPFTDERGGLIVRWMYADNDEAVRIALSHLEEAHWTDSDFLYCVHSRDLVMFDSSCSGDDVDAFLKINLEPSCYLVSTSNFKPDARTHLVLHRLTQSSQSTD